MPDKNKKIKKFRSLTVSLTFTFFCFTAAILLMLGGFGLVFNFANYQLVISEGQERIAFTTANTVNNFIQEKISILEAAPALVNLMNLEKEKSKETLEKLMGTESAFRQLVLVNVQGRELISVSRLSSFASGGLQDKAEDKMLSQVEKGENYISPVYVDNITSEPLIIIAVPLKNVFNEFEGALISELNLKFMWRVVNNIIIGEKGLVYIVDRQGNLIAFSDTSRVLKRENLSYLSNVAEFVENSDSPRKKNIANIVKGIEGNLVVSNYGQLENPDWAVFAELPVMEVYLPLMRQTLWAALLILLVFWLVVISVILLSKRVARPIISLRDAAVEIGKGNLDKKIHLKANNEIGELAETFNVMTARLKKQQERDRAISRMKSEFISITAHQLRTPLSSLKWTFDLIRDGNLGKFSEEQQEYLDNCRIANEKIIDTVNNLLDLTRIEEGRFLYEYSKARIEDLIEETVDGLKLAAERKKITIDFKKTSVPPVLIDAEKMTIAVKNLMENALSYTPRGGKIDVSIDRNAGESIIKIRDTGIGIPKRQAHKVFKKFFRAKNALEFETSGSGIGLYITKNIIEKHGGRIWFESKEGEGTCFYFTIPIKK